MKESIKNYCDKRVLEFDEISNERKKLLEKLSDYISGKIKLNQSIQLIYICTHNSRRSHFGQVWAMVASRYYHVDHVKTFSGGTEATAFNRNAINSLKRAGFEIESMSTENNPIYNVFYSESEAPVCCFSKTYDHEVNPKESFAAVMTCSDAEENCPFIPGVDLRLGTTYEDPKKFDGTSLQDAKYDERCAQIARETLYMFSKVK